jgi:hypothetical protein
LEGLVTLAKTLRGVATQLHEALGRWEVQVALCDDTTEHLATWSLDDPTNNPFRVQAVDSKDRRRDQMAEPVRLKLRHSYMTSSRELQSLLSTKCKHLALYAS